MKLLRIVVGFTVLSISACVASEHATRFVVYRENSKITLSATHFMDSGISGKNWEAKIDGGLDPFSEENKFFSLTITNKDVGFKKEIPVMPLDSLYISPDSHLIAGLSTAYPTDGVVVFDVLGHVLYKKFGLCFPTKGCPLISHSILPWFDESNTDIRFSDTTDGKNCRLTIFETSGLQEEISLNICAGNERNQQKKPERKPDTHSPTHRHSPAASQTNDPPHR